MVPGRKAAPRPRSAPLRTRTAAVTVSARRPIQRSRHSECGSPAVAVHRAQQGRHHSGGPATRRTDPVRRTPEEGGMPGRAGHRNSCGSATVPDSAGPLRHVHHPHHHPHCPMLCPTEEPPRIACVTQTIVIADGSRSDEPEDRHRLDGAIKAEERFRITPTRASGV